ncbi:hypothetical protein LMBIIBHN_00323 [Aeromonas salmonicida]
MGMIQFAGVDSVANLESTGFNRLARQPDEQGEMYQPLDLLFTEELTTLPAEVADDADVGTDVVDTVPEDATEQLESFTNMPPMFILNDEAASLSSARLAQPDVEMNSGKEGGAVQDRAPPYRWHCVRCRSMGGRRRNGHILLNRPRWARINLRSP